eukprot:7862082-Pyramimonas_sp.AAC.1
MRQRALQDMPQTTPSALFGALFSLAASLPRPQGRGWRGGGVGGSESGKFRKPPAPAWAVGFLKDNPPELKRKNLIDFAQFVRVRGEKAYKSKTEADVPMTRAAFLIWAVQVQGFSSEEADD